MKKLILFGVSLTLAFTSCFVKTDIGIVWEYYIVNRTDSDIVVKVDEGTDIKIPSGGTGEVYILSGMTNDKKYTLVGDLASCPNDVILSGGMPAPAMAINGKSMPESIWKRKYWEFTDGKQGTYTLTVTNEFLEKSGTYTATYIFKNNSLGTILFHSYSLQYSRCNLTPTDRFIEIPAGGENEETPLRIESDMGFPAILDWGGESAGNRDSTIVVMDSRRVIQRRWLDDPLYRIENYTLVSEDGYNKTYEFTFTDDFFADGEPMN